MGTPANSVVRQPSEGIVIDSILWGAQLLEIDSTDLRISSKRRSKTEAFIGRSKPRPDWFQFDYQVSVDIGRDGKRGFNSV